MSKENLQQAVEYLQENKERYSREALREQLQRAGYADDVVNKGLQQVFEQNQEQKGKSGFFDLRSRRTYDSAGEKILDFIVGFLGTYVVGFLSNMVFGVLFSLLRGFVGSGYYAIIFVEGILTVALYIGVIVYMWRRRKYIAIGMLASVLIGLLLAVVLFIFLFVVLRSAF